MEGPLIIRNVDLSRFLEIAYVGIRRASSFMALGLKIAGDESVSSVKLDANFQIMFVEEPLTKDQLADIRSSFSQWVIGNGLRELDQHLAVYVDAIYAPLLGMSGGGKLPPDWVKKHEAMKDDTNLANKLRKLEKEFGMKLSLVDHIASMSRARNAITHNLSRVAARHCNAEGRLRLTWMGLDLVTAGKVIQGPFEPFSPKGAGDMRLELSERERSFSVGELIDLSSHDLSEICLTFKKQAEQVNTSLFEFAKQCGVQIRANAPGSDAAASRVN